MAQQEREDESKVGEVKGHHSPHFDTITIYEFPISMGDNPAAREGCPVMLSSKCMHKETLDVDMYEMVREGRRRSAKNLYLPVEDRAAM